MGKTGIGIKVESEYLPDVWVYGKYHNKISKEEYDKKIIRLSMNKNCQN